MLTDIACKSAVCPPGKARARMTDAGGLYLEISPSGSKRWFWKYYFTSKEKRLALGSYPAVSLKQARSERDLARRNLQSGSDPSKRRQIERLELQLAEANTFEEVARELHTTKASGWSKQYGERWLERMEKDLFPYPRSRHPSCSTRCASLKSEAPGKPRTPCARPPARCSAIGWPPAAASAILRLIFTVLCSR